MKTSTKIGIRSVISQTVETSLVVLWLIYGVQWAANIYRFLIVVLFILTLLLWFSEKAQSEFLKKCSLSRIRIIVSADMVIALMLVGTGHFVFGALFLFHDFTALGISESRNDNLMEHVK